uniref:Large ribosomal subunit protein uL14m n=1 Tax=Phallusia mammillata TaxID=59560 RepID=A0A6F9DLU5_9ASCI|nr:39S ribosomal protein L14, mitochondrial-like [Phallusia mammillata]
MEIVRKTTLLGQTFLKNVVVRSFHQTAACCLPDRTVYDNQTFYENVRFGYKRGKNNIRNMDRDIKFLQKNAVQLLTKVRIVDNSAKALAPVRRKAKVIHIYHGKNVPVRGCVGNIVKITLNGEMIKALVVGQKAPMGVLKARMDSNNVILIDDEGNPLGTRITVPIPSWLRGYRSPTKHQAAMSKVIAIASAFV